MSLMTHRLCDALRGIGSDGLISDPAIIDKLKATLIGCIPMAEKFYFGRLSLEPSEGPGSYVMPRLTEAEIEMWSLGLIPLPAPNCLFECVIGETTSVFIVQHNESTPESWDVMRCDRVYDQRGRWHWLADGLMVHFKLGATIQNGELMVNLTVPPAARKVKEVSEEEFASNVRTHYLVLYMALMLNSKTTERTRVDRSALPKLKYTARRKGFQEMFVHTVVNITPERFIDRGDGAGGHHASPRLHWRRSHLRRYDHQTPGAKWCSTLDAPDGSKGCFAVVVPRCLVGKAELGEITHEYVVKP